MPKVVIGGGPSGVRAAAALGALLLEPEGQAGGIVHPEFGEDRGVAGAQDAQSIDEGYGAAPAVRLARGVLVRGAVQTLPLRRRQLPQMLREGSARALNDWSQTRGRQALRSLIGGGHEERSYRDWVVHRHGAAAFNLLFSSWAARRFGAPERASVSLAHLHHSIPEQAEVALGQSPEAGWKALLGRVPEVRTWVGIEGIEFEDGRAARVRTDEWTLDVDGPLYVAAPMAELADWLDDQVPTEILRELRKRPTRHRIQVGLRMAGSMPDELHVLDDAPFFRLNRAGALGGDDSLVVAHLSCDDQNPLWTSGEARVAEQIAHAASALGFGAAEAVGVQRLPDYDPVWTTEPWHPAHVRVCAALEQAGIQLVGRAATYRWVDAGQELAFAAGLGANPQDWHELQRTILDPPVRPDDERASLTRFVER